MTTSHMYGVSPYPAAIADYQGNTSVITYAESAKNVEEIFRLKCIDMGYTHALPLALTCLFTMQTKICIFSIPTLYFYSQQFY